MEFHQDSEQRDRDGSRRTLNVCECNSGVARVIPEEIISLVKR